MIPKPIITPVSDVDFSCVIGFGFDNRANDYKVLRLVISSVELRIDEHEESLVLYHYDSYHFSFEVWVMKEYGVVESWVKQFSIAE
ncbi:hypothetical protein CFOL_v3_35137 [Cephalotus follicularis]|uniref:F-box associated domain-containing protein n=1 Tax=Cephalotus follicularis TaxID=3775 RepID=A0A1Q3DHP5_CEPFO|nr:hypothetical protein CFOL_v3_12635 [Cephalotus follicularis]GAV91748.1 hypothetical protein CFOL_v3_35137 [Cephalotus follicularis]